MNREAKIAERVARSTIAGTIHAPPAMVDEIYRWCNAQVAAYDAAVIERELAYNIEFGARRKERAEATRDQIEKMKSEGMSPLDDEILYAIAGAKNDEEYVEAYSREQAQNEAKLAEKMKIVGSFPRVRVKEWKQVQRKFKVDMSGWRYRQQVMGVTEKKRHYADKRFGVITVGLTKGNLKTRTKGYWQAQTSSLRLKAGGDLKWIIEHEMRHWVQSYMGAILPNPLDRSAPLFGRPSKKIKTPDVNQWTKGDKAKKLKKERGIEKSEFHNLDDIEFYTDLEDEIVFFRRIDKAWGDNTDHFPEKMDLLKVFVGDKKPPVRLGPKGKNMVSKYFMALKKHAPGKWRKAVKELAKAVR